MPLSAILGPIIGGIISGAGQSYAAKKNAEAQREAADLAYERSQPWNVSGAMGGVTFDEEGRAVDLTLSPEMEAIRQASLADAKRQIGFLSGLEADPQAAAEQLYQQELGLLQPEQERELSRLEESEFARGTLGGTGGALRRQAALQAQGNVRAGRRIGANERIQSLIDRYRGRVSGSLGTATQLAQQPLAYGQFGSEVGARLSPAAEFGGRALSGAGLTQASATSGLFKGLGTSIGNVFSPSTATGLPSINIGGSTASYIPPNLSSSLFT
jgi:hypothetical protein